MNDSFFWIFSCNSSFMPGSKNFSNLFFFDENKISGRALREGNHVSTYGEFWFRLSRIMKTKLVLHWTIKTFFADQNEQNLIASSNTKGKPYIKYLIERINFVVTKIFGLAHWDKLKSQRSFGSSGLPRFLSWIKKKKFPNKLFSPWSCSKSRGINQTCSLLKVTS